MELYMPDDSSEQSSPGRSWLGRLSHLFSNDPENRSELLEMVQAARENGVLDVETSGIVEGALAVANLQARDIMIPRVQMITINLSDSPQQFLPTVIDSAHSRFPILGDDADEVVGTLLAKDLLPLALDQSLYDHFRLKDLLRPAFVIPESKRLDSLLHDFRVNRNHMAVVINEYGGLAGLVTIEDVLEQIVGNIEDEHDREEDFSIHRDTDGSFLLKAQTPIEDFNDFFSSRLTDEEFDTIGGLVLQHLGRVPEAQEHVSFDGFRFTILAANSRAIQLLRASPYNED